jgi:DNA-binding CsgD family transcriptional regulator
VLLGRRSEIEVLDRLLDAARGGRSGVLVLRGDPGVGKTALLEHTIESTSGFRIARATGAESEMELPFAGLHQLCAPMLDRLEGLPDPQREALAVAFGLSGGPAPDRFLVGLAVLNLLSQVAETQPLLCAIDDAQWLDRASAQTLAFLARRLLAESVALVIATREPSAELAGLPELVVEGLRNGDARALLGSALHVPIDARVRERIVAETRGNPLALLELPRGLTPAQLAGGFGLPDELKLSGRIEERFRARVGALPADSRHLLLVAAAEPVGDPLLVWRAAERLGIVASAADAAEASGLIRFGSRVMFRHPLVRSAVYRAASPEARREVHRALAEATGPDIDPDRRAWHRAQATPGPDEEVACELESSAGRAQARGGLAAAAAFLERAAALTLDPGRRAGRALAAAHATQRAGAPDAALKLLATAEAGPLDELERAQVDELRAQIAFASNRGRDAPPLLLAAAKRLEPLDPRLAREAYLDAFSAAIFAGRLATAGAAREVADSARARRASPDRRGAPELLLDGLAALIADGHTAGAPILKRAIGAFSSDDVTRDEELRWLWLASHAAALLWDYESWDRLSARRVQVARDVGALSVLPIALSTRAGVHLFAGELGVAASLAEEVRAVTEATEGPRAPYPALAVSAFRGRAAEAFELIEDSTKELVRRGEGEAVTFVQWTTAVLHNSLGRYEEALAAAAQAAEDSHEIWFSTWGLVELIEAAARSVKPERATDALERLAEIAAASGTDWVLGIHARSRALLSNGEDAESLYRQAIDHLRGTRLRVDLARCHLVYGEWLRRERRRIDAREELRPAHELFTEIGMEAFAERARVELKATGDRARKRTVTTRDDLTPQEAQIARLAAEGETNAAIASRLFISASTVDYHLRKTFRKLGIKSRVQLARHLHEQAVAPKARRRD